jgi:hypothetical protein
MPKNPFSLTIAGFTEYIKVTYAKEQANLSKYGISSSKLTTVTMLYNTYIQAEAITANPETTTIGTRRAHRQAS